MSGEGPFTRLNSPGEASPTNQSLQNEAGGIKLEANSHFWVRGRSLPGEREKGYLSQRESAPRGVDPGTEKGVKSE